MGCHKPKPTLGDIATAVGVAVGIMVGAFYGLGTIAHSSYFNGLGFDAHQLPALGYELQLTGVVYFVLPALGVFILVLLYACLSALADRASARLVHVPAKWRIPIGGFLFLAGAAHLGWRLFSQPETLHYTIYALIFMGTLLLGAILFGKWVTEVGMWCLFSVPIVLMVIIIVSGQAYKFGQERAVEILNSKQKATTIIEFADGSKKPAPGERIVCSEHFCGFHDGKKATVISLEGVRSIQSPSPQPADQPPPAQPDDAGSAPAASGAPEADK